MIPMKSLVTIWLRIASTYPETSPRTLKRAERLFLTNPQYYLTQYLPMLGKLVDRSLSDHRLPSFTTIVKTRHDGVPHFLSEYFDIFYKDGYLSEFDPTVLRKFRTLCYMFYKYELPFSAEMLITAKEKFISTDMSVMCDYTQDHIRLIKATFNDLLPDDPLDIKCRHSSGATACSYNNIERRMIFRFIPSLHSVFPPTYYFGNVINWKMHYDEHGADIVELPSKVTFVPKDSRGPRTICMEPHERMYVQQGLMHKLYEHIENYSSARGRINFTDQSINQFMAYRSSYDGKYATLDLRDASDLVSNSLIMQLCNDEWRAVLTATRSSHARIDDNLVKLKKYAPMGSALCFPIEAMLFYSIAKIVTDDVYVYGDDIIVPTECANLVKSALSWYGLVVNEDKSLTTGNFRESCGFDAYQSHDITPVRCRRLDFVSAVAFANNLRNAHGIEVAEAFIDVYESLENVIIPRLTDHSDTTGAVALYASPFNNLVLFKRRWNKNLQRYEFRMPCNTTKTRTRVPDGLLSYCDYLQSCIDSNNPIEDSLYVSRDPYKKYDEIRKPNERFALQRSIVGWKWVSYIV